MVDTVNDFKNYINDRQKIGADPAQDLAKWLYDEVKQGRTVDQAKGDEVLAMRELGMNAAEVNKILQGVNISFDNDNATAKIGNGVITETVTASANTATGTDKWTYADDGGLQRPVRNLSWASPDSSWSHNALSISSDGSISQPSVPIEGK